MSQTLDSNSALDFLHPLQKRTRSAAVTAQIAEMSRLNISAVLRRAADTDPARRMERETLVALARGFLRSGNTTDADTVLEILIGRVSKAIAAKVSIWARLTREDKIDAQRQMIFVLCDQVSDLSPAAEFWECNFTFCFNKRLITLWHSLTDRKVPTVPAAITASSGEAMDLLDQQPDPADAFADIELQSLVEMVSGENAQKSKAIFLRLSGFSEEEIAARLGVTSRTLRNWTAEARAVWNGRAR